MTTANIIRPEVTDNYTSLPNQLLGYGRHIKGLKPRDSAVLNYLLSKPPHWKIIAKEITVALNISINTVYAALTVLQRLGIASYTRDKFGHTQWLVSVASTLYSPVIPPYTKIPHQENCDVLENNEKSKINVKTTTRSVSEGDLGTASPPNDYINPVSIASIGSVVEPVVQAIKIEIDASEQLLEPIAIVETPSPELELPEQLTEVEKLVAKKSITKANLDTTTYAVVMLALKTALTSGDVHSPIAYLHGLINKAKEGTLDASKYNELKTKKSARNRSDEIKSLFAKYGDSILRDLITNGAVHVQSLGLIQYDEVNKLGLVSDEWVKKYADVQLQKMVKLTPNKPTTASNKKPVATMNEAEFEAKRQAQIDMAMAVLNNS